LDHFDFSRIDEKIFFSSFAPWIKLLASSAFSKSFVFGMFFLQDHILVLDFEFRSL